MVQLTEVEDEHFQNQKEVEYDDDEDFTDTGEFFPTLLIGSSRWGLRVLRLWTNGREMWTDRQTEE